MVALRRGGYPRRMTTTTALPSSSIGSAASAHPSARSAGRPLALVAGLVLAVFGAFSVWVVASQGYFGFLALAGREPWGLQILLDLVIAASFAAGWMIADARKRRIASWPYLIVTVVLGSIGILAYCVRRAFAPITPPPGT
jgi:hypothetical protein